MYTVEWKPRAERAFLALSQPVRDVMELKVNALARDPRPVGCRKMVGYHDTYRIRVGDYRVVYEIHDDVLVVLVVAVGPRKSVYRRK